MKPDVFWVSGPWRGKLAIAARPRGGDWLNDEATGWRRAGVDVVVSLLENDEVAHLDLDGECQAAEQNSISFISFPIPDRGVPASLEDAASLMTRIADQLNAGKNVAVHCRQGVGRSGMIAAGVLVAAGSNPDKAIEAVSSARGAEVPETTEQRRWMQQLLSRLAVPKS